MNTNTYTNVNNKNIYTINSIDTINNIDTINSMNRNEYTYRKSKDHKLFMNYESLIMYRNVNYII